MSRITDVTLFTRDNHTTSDVTIQDGVGGGGGAGPDAVANDAGVSKGRGWRLQ